MSSRRDVSEHGAGIMQRQTATIHISLPSSLV